MELLNDYQIGLIQKEELQEAIGEISLSNYIAARKSFHQKYGYYPIKVPVYGLDGLDILRFEKGGSYNDRCSLALLPMQIGHEDTGRDD